MFEICRPLASGASTDPLEGIPTPPRTRLAIEKGELWRRYINIAACPAAIAKQKMVRSIAASTANKRRGMLRNEITANAVTRVVRRKFLWKERCSNTSSVTQSFWLRDK